MKLWQKVLIGLVLGVVFGALMRDFSITLAGDEYSGPTILTDYIKPVGTLFINMIKMVVIPLIFFSLIAGITSMTDNASFKRIGGKSVAAYLFTGAFAVVIGLVFGSIFQPGAGLDLSALSTHAVNSSSLPVAADERTSLKIVVDLLVSIVPSNVFKAMVEDHVLQVVVFAIFTAVTLNMLGEKVKGLVEVIHQAAYLVFKMIEIIVRFSPYGVFALISWAVCTQGFELLERLVLLIFTTMGALFVQYLLFGVMIVVFGRMSPWPFYRKIVEAQSLAFSTSSSKATLSTAMRVVNERMGVSKTSTTFVLPLGASINMDGTAIYLGITALFFAQAYGIDLHAHEYLVLILTATLGSIGAAGIPSGSLIMMGMVFTSVGIPLEGIGIIAAIDRILDMMRTTINITGDSVITLLIDKTEGTLDEKAYNDKSL